MSFGGSPRAHRIPQRRLRLQREPQDGHGEPGSGAGKGSARDADTRDDAPLHRMSRTAKARTDGATSGRAVARQQRHDAPGGRAPGSARRSKATAEPHGAGRSERSQQTRHQTRHASRGQERQSRGRSSRSGHGDERRGSSGQRHRVQHGQGDAQGHAEGRGPSQRQRRTAAPTSPAEPPQPPTRAPHSHHKAKRRGSGTGGASGGDQQRRGGGGGGGGHSGRGAVHAAPWDGSVDAAPAYHDDTGFGFSEHRHGADSRGMGHVGAASDGTPFVDRFDSHPADAAFAPLHSGHASDLDRPRLLERVRRVSAVEDENDRLRAQVRALKQRCDDLTTPAPAVASAHAAVGVDPAIAADKARSARDALLAGHVAQLQRQVLRLTKQLNAMADYGVETESALRDILAHVERQSDAAQQAVASGTVPKAGMVVPRSDVPLYGVPSDTVQLCKRLVARLGEAHATARRLMAEPVLLGRSTFHDDKASITFGNLYGFADNGASVPASSGPRIRVDRAKALDARLCSLAEQLRRLSLRFKHSTRHFSALPADGPPSAAPSVAELDSAIAAIHQASFDLVSLSILVPAPAPPRRLASPRATLRSGVALPSFKELLQRLPSFARSQRTQGNEVLRELLNTCRRREDALLARARCLSDHVRAHEKIADLHRDNVGRLMGGLEQQWIQLVEFLKGNVARPMQECFLGLESIGGLRTPASLDRAADIVSRIKVVTQAIVSSAAAATAAVERDFSALRGHYAEQCARVQAALVQAAARQHALEKEQAGWEQPRHADGTAAGHPASATGAVEHGAAGAGAAAQSAAVATPGTSNGAPPTSPTAAARGHGGAQAHAHAHMQVQGGGPSFQLISTASASRKAPT